MPPAKEIKTAASLTIKCSRTVVGFFTFLIGHESLSVSLFGYARSGSDQCSSLLCLQVIGKYDPAARFNRLVRKIASLVLCKLLPDIASRLELQPHLELNPARRVPLRRDLAKVGAGDVNVGEIILRAVQGVDKVN